LYPNDLDRFKTGTVRLIVCDLDSTLLNSQKLISGTSLKAIQAARERGIFVTICTGRIPEMMEVYSRILEIHGCIIAANGAVIMDTRDGSCPYEECLDGREARKFLEFCLSERFDHMAATAEGCYYSPGSERIKKFEQYNEIAGKENLKQIPLYPFGSDYQNTETMKIYKLLASGLSTGQQRKTEDFLATLPNSCYTSSEPGLLDINAAGVNKGRGVQILAGIMGYAKEEICVFGDYYNDIPMFEAAGFSVAMGNGDDEVKRKATVITGTNDEDGVAMAIEKYFLGK